jgi:hypothetical protein
MPLLTARLSPICSRHRLTRGRHQDFCRRLRLMIPPFADYTLPVRQRPPDRESSRLLTTAKNPQTISTAISSKCKIQPRAACLLRIRYLQRGRLLRQ